MHEMSIATALKEQVQTFLPPRAALREVRIEVGSLEHLDDVVMQMAWESLVELEDATRGSALVIDRIPIRIRCRDCSCEYQPEDHFAMACPDCGAARPEVLQGSGIVLRGVTYDEEES
jgi:hydrogenase nickel incorporation protein HypA/HybF